MRKMKCRLIRKGEVVGYAKDGPLYYVTAAGDKEFDSLIWYYNTINSEPGSNHGWHPKPIPHDAKEWFAGKVGKAGAEIYEGDKVRALVEDMLCIGYIVWEASQSAWKVQIINPPHRRGRRFMYELSIGDIEVIGRAKK